MATSDKTPPADQSDSATTADSKAPKTKMSAKANASEGPMDPREAAALGPGTRGILNVDHSDRTAIIVGGSEGIGAACSLALARSGAHVVVADVPDQDPDSIVARINEEGGEAEVWDVNLRDHEVLAELHLECDILVNCAGSQIIAPIEKFPAADWDRIIDIMLTSPFLLTRAALPHMYEKEWGRVINISGVHGLRGSEGRAAYTAAKHGLEGLTKVTAIEAATHNVTANCINPGFVDTPQVKKQMRQLAAMHWMPEDEVQEKILMDRAAIKDMVPADDVAAQVLWLTSNYADHITGSNIVIDGGWTAS